MSATKIFIIDDDDFTAIHLEAILGDDYALQHFSDAASALDVVGKEMPSLILMDVNMPGMNGYDACRRLKENEAARDIPVVFLSARVEVEDRLAGYEAGGDDYLTKPFDPEELQSKVAIVLRNYEKNRTLKSHAHRADEVAMTAMSTVTDVNIVLRFMREMVGCLDLSTLTDLVFRTADDFSCDISLQLREKGLAVLSRSRGGICSPLEESVLANMALCDSIVDLGRRSAFNRSRVTLIVKNMPLANPAAYARLKDSMATIVEILDHHLESLEVVNEVLVRGDNLMQLLKSNTTALREIEQRYHHQRHASAEILDSLVASMEDSFIHLGLTESQERYLQDMVRTASEQAQALYNDAIEVESIMARFNGELGGALQQEVDGVVEASNGAQRVELF